MQDEIKLTARIVDPLHFVFVPKTWTKELKPVSKAHWSYWHGHANKTEGFRITEGDMLAFPQFNMTNGGFYAAHLYLVIKEMDCPQVRATLTVEGLTLESIEGEVKTRVTLKPQGISKDDVTHRVTLQ